MQGNLLRRRLRADRSANVSKPGVSANSLFDPTPGSNAGSNAGSDAGSDARADARADAGIHASSDH